MSVILSEAARNCKRRSRKDPCISATNLLALALQLRRQAVCCDLLFRGAGETVFALRFLTLWARVFISTPIARPAIQIWNCILIADLP